MAIGSGATGSLCSGVCRPAGGGTTEYRQDILADEAHSQAHGDLRGKWVLKGTPALVDPTSPRRGETSSCYSAVCLETGELELMELVGNSNSTTSATFLRQLRAQHTETADGNLGQFSSPSGRRATGQPDHSVTAPMPVEPRVKYGEQALPSYSPDFNADEAIWG